MLTTKLLETLLNLERSIGHADHLTLRTMVMDAETQLIAIEKDVLSVFEELRLLRERQEPFILHERCIPISDAPPPRSERERSKAILSRAEAFVS